MTDDWQLKAFSEYYMVDQNPRFLERTKSNIIDG